MRTARNRRTYRQHLANPIPGVICVAVLTVILLLTGYLHVPAGL
jgi:hypothetical protein